MMIAILGKRMRNSVIPERNLTELDEVEESDLK